MKNAPFISAITSVYVMKTVPSKNKDFMKVVFFNDPEVGVSRCSIQNVEYDVLCDFVVSLFNVVVGNIHEKHAEQYTIRQNQDNLVVKFYGFEFLVPKDDFQITKRFCRDFYGLSVSLM